MRETTPHPAASQPPSPSRGEGDRGTVAQSGKGKSVDGAGSTTAADADLSARPERENDPGPPSPLEGEGARRADEGLPTKDTDAAALAAIAERDLSKRRRARAEWRTPATKRLRGFARNMRHAPTEAERRLWSLVRDRRLDGYKFRPQVPIGRYVVDMLCADHKLIVELDGSQHADSVHDEERDAWLRAQGFRILRIWNPDMLARPNGVLELIWSNLQEQQP